MTIETILVPTDFGEPADRAVDVGVALAEKFAAKLLVLHVFYVPPVAYEMDSGLAIQQMTADAKDALGSLMARVKRVLPAAESVWADAKPKHGVMDTILARDCDLVVVGTHGRRGLSRVFFGSVSTAMLKTCPVPLITVGAQTHAAQSAVRFKHILVPTDFGEPAEEAITLACEIANRFDARITIAHACPLAMADYGDSAWSPGELVAVERRQLESAVERARKLTRHVEGAFVRGDPREEILRLSRDKAADLVAMGTRQTRGLSRMLVGSTAEAVTRGTTLPVLTTHGGSLVEPSA